MHAPAAESDDDWLNLLACDSGSFDYGDLVAPQEHSEACGCEAAHASAGTGQGGRNSGSGDVSGPASGYGTGCGPDFGSGDQCSGRVFATCVADDVEAGIKRGRRLARHRTRLPSAQPRPRLRPHQQVALLRRQLALMLTQMQVLQHENSVLRGRATVLDAAVADSDQYMALYRSFAARDARSADAFRLQQANLEETLRVLSGWTLSDNKLDTFHVETVVGRIAGHNPEVLRGLTLEQIRQLGRAVASEASLCLLDPQPESLRAIRAKLEASESLMLGVNLVNPLLLYQLEAVGWEDNAGPPELEHWRRALATLALTQQQQSRIAGAYEVFKSCLSRMHEVRRHLLASVPPAWQRPAWALPTARDNLASVAETLGHLDKVRASLRKEPFLYYWFGKVLLDVLAPQQLAAWLVHAYPHFPSVTMLGELVLEGRQAAAAAGGVAPAAAEAGAAAPVQG